MRRKLGVVCLFLGFLLLSGSLALYLHNRQEDRQAEQGAMEVLPQILDQIPEEPDQEQLMQQLVPLEFRDPSTFQMTEVVINGYGYIGYLSIPSLDLNLPIMGSWDKIRLQIAPCRYYGSVNGEDLVLMAHNYEAHFGQISQLKTGDSVVFTDMDGITTAYQVAARDVLAPDAVEEMTSGDFDLTLFTCTYGGENRVTVYCDKE
ncbi:MAG: sortase [Oscillospiraceae bacterium]|nr:sortase [Oscillospiraceae bacterium]